MRITLSDHFTYKKIIRFTFPTVMMMVVQSFYSIVDSLFVSNLVGTTAFASLNLIWPLIMILTGVASMIGIGGNALVAKTLGEDHWDRANRFFTMFTAAVIVVSVILSAVGIVFIRQIASLLERPLLFHFY